MSRKKGQDTFYDCRYNSDDPDASNDGASNYSYDGMEPPLLLSR